MEKIRENYEYDNNGYIPKGGVIDLAQVEKETHDIHSENSQINLEKMNLKGRHPELKEKESTPFNKLNMNHLDETEFCHMWIKDGICLNNAKHQVGKFALEDGLIGFWDFNNILNVDLSGSRSVIEGEVKAGPGVDYPGSSAFFNGDNFLTVKHRKELNSKELTYSFWIYLVTFNSEEKGTNLKCPLLLKGEDVFGKGEYDRYPGIYIDEETRKIRVYASLESKERFKDGIWTETLGRVGLQRWTHIAVTISKSKIQVYLNGILDSLQTLEGRKLKGNEHKLYIGNHPTYLKACKLAFYIDNLKIYNTVVPSFSIQAESGSTLGNFSPYQIMIGCQNCNFEEATRSCIKHYHLCTEVEMVTGGFQVVRIIGWLENTSSQIIYDKGNANFKKKKGSAFCCRNYLA